MRKRVKTLIGVLVSVAALATVVTFFIYDCVKHYVGP